ncbi:MAG: response regulator [Balneolaceae bacterium]
MQTKDKDVEHLVSKSIKEEDIRFRSIESSEDLREYQSNGNIITFIIGSDVDDPIQSAQRLHAFKKNAKIIFLTKSEQKVIALKEAIKFSPFVGSDVNFLDESKDGFKSELIQTFQDSLQAEKYRATIAETNRQVSTSISSQKSVFNQNFINRLMDIAPIGIAIIGLHRNVLGWNKEASLIFKRTEIQALGKPLAQYFDKSEGKRLENYIRDNFSKRKGPAESLTLERRLLDDSNQILNLTAASFTYTRGNEKALILVIKDETEREKARRELQEINLTLEERVDERTASLLAYQDQLRSLASQLSKAEEMERQRLATELHDNLGQMLAVSKMKISTLKKYQLPEESASDVEDIIEGVDDALNYTRDLMSDLKPPPSLDKEDIRVSIKWLASKMEKHDLHVIIEDDGQPKPVDDEIRIILVQCVRELLFNIIKHSGVKEARIGLIRLEKETKIIVEDKGKGFNTGFNNFMSEEDGFGLFNISERIDLLGGSMTIESEPKKGTKITLCAPIKDGVQKEEIPEVEKSDVPPKPESKTDIVKVLLVDDHQMMREGLRKIINTQKDLTVIAEASNGEEALNEAEKTSPDIVVMDVNMPVMDGIEATQKLMEKMPNVRVIGLSFHDHQNVAESMRSAGATAYLTKNEAFEALCATIRSEVKLARK